MVSGDCPAFFEITECWGSYFWELRTHNGFVLARCRSGGYRRKDNARRDAQRLRSVILIWGNIPILDDKSQMPKGNFNVRPNAGASRSR